MRIHFICLILAFTLLPRAGWSSNGSQIQIKKFRFHQHLGADFERLVLEFTQKGAGLPNVRVLPLQNGKEASLNIGEATLIGAIPEATINDSYSKTSRYIGPISINNDNPSLGFTIRTFVKNPTVSIDAFWLKSPTRLIVDVYPKGSLRANGPDVLKHSASRRLASTKKGGLAPNRNVICFFTAAQVHASLGFELGAAPKALNMTVDDSGVNYAADKNVICYPYSAQAQPKVTFDLRTGAPRISSEPVQEQRPVVQTPAVQTPAKQPWNVGRPLTKEEQLNRDADLALGLPGDEELDGRGLASPGLFDGTDNFDKNKPPPSLGKNLAPAPGRPALQANPAPGGFIVPGNR